MQGFGSPPKNFDVQGHRGCAGLMPENTIAAFIKAVQLGVTTIELDVVISQDNKVVVSHDPFLNKKICLSPTGEKVKRNADFNLYKMPYEEIKKCDCSSLEYSDFTGQDNYKPLLVDAINAVKEYCFSTGRVVPVFNVEIKSNPKKVGISQPAIPEFCELVMTVLQENLPTDKYYLQSFDITVLQYLKSKYPTLKIAYLVMGYVKKTNRSFNKDLKKLGFTPDVYSCYFPIISIKLIKEAHSKSIAVIPWTVNENEDLKDLIQMGVDGIITDYPNRLLNLVEEMK